MMPQLQLPAVIIPLVPTILEDLEQEMELSKAYADAVHLLWVLARICLLCWLNWLTTDALGCRCCLSFAQESHSWPIVCASFSEKHKPKTKKIGNISEIFIRPKEATHLMVANQICSHKENYFSDFGSVYKAYSEVVLQPHILHDICPFSLQLPSALVAQRKRKSGYSGEYTHTILRKIEREANTRHRKATFC